MWRLPAGCVSAEPEPMLQWPRTKSELINHFPSSVSVQTANPTAIRFSPDTTQTKTTFSPFGRWMDGSTTTDRSARGSMGLSHRWWDICPPCLPLLFFPPSSSASPLFFCSLISSGKHDTADLEPVERTQSVTSPLFAGVYTWTVSWCSHLHRKLIVLCRPPSLP